MNKEKEKLEQQERLDRWKTNPEYRKKVVRELEESGTILPMSSASFGSIVFGDSGENPEELEEEELEV